LRLGIDNNPRPPWQLNYAVYLLNPADASLYTYVNSTMGAKIAWIKLRERVQLMRALRGAGVFPVVELASAPMKGKFAKTRPEFKIREWTDLSGGAAATAPKAIESKPTAAIGRPVAQPTLQEAIDDEIPF
jgi:hypothetical protein